MIELTLPTMTCEHCVRTVTETVRKLDPQAQVSIDLAQHKLQIESTHPLDGLRAALTDEGYAPA